MSKPSFIPVQTLCSHYKVETTFFQDLNDYGLVEITTVEKLPCVEEKHIKNLDAIVRLHEDLKINFEGIDTVLHLLDKIQDLQRELVVTKNRLRVFEE